MEKDYDFLYEANNVYRTKNSDYSFKSHRRQITVQNT